MSTKSRGMPPYKRSAALVLTLEFQGLSLSNRAGLRPRRADFVNDLVLCLFGITRFSRKEKKVRAPVTLAQRASHSQASNKRELVYPDRIGRKLSDCRRFWSN